MPLHEIIFIIGNLTVAPFWALMILAPRWRWTERILQSLLPVIVLALLYTLTLLLSVFAGGLDATRLTFDLSGVAYLLGTTVGAAAAWLHMLTFDLFVGRWLYLDSRPRKLPVWLVSITLFFVFFTGPFGLLLYLALRHFQTKS